MNDMAQKLYLISDTTKKQKDHRILAKHKIKVLGVLSGGLYKRSVMSAFNRANLTEDRTCLYSGAIVRKQVKLIAKLYMVQKDKGKPHFAAICRPDGIQWAKRAKLRIEWFDRSPVEYPSRPPINPEYESKLREITV